MELHPEGAYVPRYPTAKAFDRRSPGGAGRRLAVPLTACALAALLTGCGQSDYQTEGAPPSPLWMPQADVLAVIRDEAERQGISLSGDGGGADLEEGPLTVDPSDGSIGFSYIDYDAGESLPTDSHETLDGGMSVYRSGDMDLCVLDGLDLNAGPWDEEALRAAFREFADWLRENGKL